MFLKKSLISAILIASFFNFAQAKGGNDLYILNWSDYIAPDTIKNFEKQTGIKVHYSLMDSNEVLEAKMMAGASGYDIIVPSIHVLKTLSDSGLLLKLDKSKIPNISHLDPLKMKKIATIDKDNAYGIPYMELSTGIGYNKKKVQEILGKDYKIDSWDIVFDPNISSKLKACGISLLDSPSDMICSALIYLNKDPQSVDPKDYKSAQLLLTKAAKNANYLHSSLYVNDLASGEICVAVGWSGDIQIASARAKEAKKDDIEYMIPKEGALMGYDMMAIPKDARNVENAYKFLNYILEPKVMASISNYIRYANANKDATEYVDKDISSNPGIYYPSEQLKRMYIVVPQKQALKMLSDTWNNVRANSGN